MHNMSELYDTSFLVRLGNNVRDARARAGLSRRSLSEASGVSERYLAQLESGQSNISILLLKRIAGTLGVTLPELLVPSAGPVASQRARRISLIGLRGAGKSTLGRLAAAALELPFVELNHEIERASGMPVTEVMALYGQEGYRRLEQQALETLTRTQDALVLAVAGGIVSESDTFAHLLHHTHAIWLSAQPEEHMARVRAQGDLRPMAGIPAAMEELRTILTSREALYARAQAQVDTSGRSVEASLVHLLGVVRGLVAGN